MSAKMNVPVLRFKEFSGEWEEKKIKNILSIGSGKDYKHLKDGDIPVYGTGGYMTSVNEYLYDGESVCIGRKGTIDKPVLISGKFWTVDTLFYTHSYQKSIPKFVFSIFQKINWKQYNEASGVPSLSKSTIETIKVNIPSLPEQEKIASFLSSVDTKIEQLTKKKTLLEQYKKGVMQKIFSQEIRFRDDDGSEYPEWVERKLNEIVNRYDNLRIPISSSNRISGNTPYYGANGIQDYVQGFTHEGEFILIAEDGANNLRNYPIQYVNGRIWVNNHAHVLQAKKDIANNKFLKYSFSKINMEPFLVGGGRAKLNANIMMQINTLLPCIEEQTKIANFLSSIDTKISQTGQQLEATKQFKKALLQKMFV